MVSVISKSISILWSIGMSFLLAYYINLLDYWLYIFNFTLALVLLVNILQLFIRQGRQERILSILSLVASNLVFIGILTLLIVDYSLVEVLPSKEDVFPITFILLLLVILQTIQSIISIRNGLFILLTIPVAIVALGAQMLVALIDIIFPPKLQELVPYIEVTKEMILSISQILASETRLQTEQALDSLGNVSGRVTEIAEGYALRKGLGQGIDIGLTIVVFAGFGVLSILQDDLHIPPQLIAALFASLGLALSTFAGVFGPFYGLAGACKDFTLNNGCYRGATIYKALEQMFSIPFMAASAGFLFLDLPPIDADTLEDFRGEMQEQLNDISDNFNSLIGTDASAVPRKTRKMIEELMTTTEQGLSKLDFRNIRKETNRAFALTYFQHEFSWRPWKRKAMVQAFADRINFDLEEAEDALKLIGYKIQAGQMDEDMVNNVMVSAALKGVIMMEQKYQELFGDAELGQTCTGLAFGARQFLSDHYVVREKTTNFFITLKNFFLFLFAVPIVITLKLHSYFNRIFDELSAAITDIIIEGRGVDIIRIRVREIYVELLQVPNKVKNMFKSKKVEKTIEEKEEEKIQRNWQLKRILKVVISKIWEVIIFPFTVLFGLFKWFSAKFQDNEENTRQLFEEAVSHAALVSMYEELYKKLVLQSHLSY